MIPTFATMDYLKDLNEQQRLAVECTEGPVMIIAGAGSGKTRVLTCRIAHKIKQGADPFNILALTFTNKAAKEMKERIVEMTGPDSAYLWMGTFHSVFSRILRVEHDKLNYPSQFTIYDNEDSKNLLKDIIRGMNLDEKIYKPNIVLDRISAAKNSLLTAADYLENTEAAQSDRSSGRPRLGEIYLAYETRCFKAGAMDFDDLLFKTYQLLEQFPEALHKYQNKFKYLLIDEFQDTNFLQYIIMKKLAAQHENICVVGDDAQSIYAFRGANIQNILSFEKDYPDLNTFRLEQNYRSTETIVSAANSLIEHNVKQLPKTIWTSNAAGEKIKLLRALSDNEEGNLVAHGIFQEKMNLHRRNQDFAILYRTNAQSRALEEALRKLNIPYRIYGGLSFYKRKEIKDLLAYIRLAINPRDEEALKRVINFPARGIGDTTIERIIIAADQHKCSLWEVIENLSTIPVQLNGPTRQRINDFAIMIQSFGVTVKTQDAYEAAKFIAQKSGILKEYFSKETPEEISRYENIQELLNAIKEFTEKPAAENTRQEPDAEPVSEARTLDVFMQDIALLTDADDDKDQDQDRVSLMTIHAAKGLEFPHVFVTGMEENLFPSQFMLSSRDELEEERRLFYVAITRAKERLTLTYAVSRYRWGNLTGCELSRFVEEINPEFIERVSGSKPTRMHQEEPVFQNNFRNYKIENSSFYKKNQKPAAPKPQSATPARPPAGFTAVKHSRPSSSDATFVGDDLNMLQVGMNVEHQKFGTGKVLQLEGKTPDVKATIFFPDQGQKQLLLKFAKLKILE